MKTTKLLKTCPTEERLKTYFRTMILLEIGMRSMTAEDLANILDTNLLATEGLLAAKDHWRLETCIRIIDALGGMKITVQID